jgi:hypothetical protein
MKKVFYRLTRTFAFYPGDAIEGFLLGRGSARVPANYLDRMVIPMQIVAWGGPVNHAALGYEWVSIVKSNRCQ